MSKRRSRQEGYGVSALQHPSLTVCCEGKAKARDRHPRVKLGVLEESSDGRWRPYGSHVGLEVKKDETLVMECHSCNTKWPPIALVNIDKVCGLIWDASKRPGVLHLGSTDGDYPVEMADRPVSALAFHIVVDLLGKRIPEDKIIEAYKTYVASLTPLYLT
jgi:hypothetical protein